MFLGHFALGLAGKRLAPRTPLAADLLAAQWADVAWPVFLLAGWEAVRIDPGNTPMTPLDFERYPYSHSLVALAVWAALFAGVALARRWGTRGAWVLGALVLSHWGLDALTHRPDMPVLPGGPLVGLGLWRSVRATVAVELLLFAGCLGFYMRGTRALDAIGRYGLMALVALLLVAYGGAVFGPPPPSVAAIVWADLAGAAVFLGLAAWIDRHRGPRLAPGQR